MRSFCPCYRVYLAKAERENVGGKSVVGLSNRDAELGQGGIHDAGPDVRSVRLRGANQRKLSTLRRAFLLNFGFACCRLFS
jgi:hypothetical protein